MKLGRTEFRTAMFLGAVVSGLRGHYDPSVRFSVIWYSGMGVFIYQLLKSIVKQIVYSFDPYRDTDER